MPEKTTMTIGTRLALGFGLVLALMVALTAFGINKVSFIDKTLTEITDINAVKQRYAINFRGSVHDRAISLRDVTLVAADQQPPVLSEIERLAGFYQESAVALDKIFAADAQIAKEEKDLLANIKASEARTLPLMRKVIATLQGGDAESARQILLSDARPALVEWLANINRFIDYQEQKNQVATSNTRSVTSRFAILMVALCALAILLGASIAFQITRRLSRSLGGEPDEAARVVEQIASGNLTTPISPSHPESMLAAIARMQTGLQGVFAEISQATISVSNKADQVGKASRAARQAAADQADASSASAANIEQMTVSIGEVSQIARKTESNSARTVDLSAQGAEMVGNAAAEMARIAETVTASSGQILSLQQRSQEVGGIANVIKEIAEQTNLLALNAAIEAARAGESGRGFAVVADEVRKLAERTTTATAEIGRMIAVIQSETHQSVTAMETTAPQVEKGLALTTEATNMLGEINRQAQDSLRQVREVARATEQQASTAAEVAKHMERISSMTVETNQAMQENTVAVSDLEQISTSLKEQVSKFKLN